MDFDEYEYLEKTVVTPTAAKENGDTVKAESKEDSAKSSKRRSEEDGHRSEHRSKRSKGDDDGKDEKERDRSSRHHRDREHRSSKYDKERESRRDSDRERKSRDDERGDREHRRRDKDRDHRERRDREGSKDSSHRDRDKDVRDRRSRERRDKKDDATAEPEADPERDQRTVFAWQICLKATEKDVYEFFSKAGKVRDVRLIMDRNSRRSKGVGYIEFYDSMSVPLALAMSGQLLLGQAVMVKPSEAEKNLVHAASSAAAAGGGFSGSYSGGARRLYVGNLHVNITEEQLRQVFEPFGIVELVQLPTDPETGLCKGYGFVQYQKLEDARCAQIALNGVLELAGRPVKVSAVSDQQTGQELGITQGDLDDDEGGGLALNARSRALLMQKLDRSGIATSSMLAAPVPAPLVPQPVGVLGGPMFGMPLGMTTPAVVEEPIGTPSDCLLLKNMFDPATEVDPDFDLDIKEDVQEECSKHGTVKHIYVDKRSAGHVYVRFSSTQAAVSAQRALHKRWFAGKSIIATFMTSQAYEAKFPESKYTSRV